MGLNSPPSCLSPGFWDSNQLWLPDHTISKSLAQHGCAKAIYNNSPEHRPPLEVLTRYLGRTCSPGCLPDSHKGHPKPPFLLMALVTAEPHFQAAFQECPWVTFRMEDPIMSHKASSEDILFHTLLPAERRPRLSKGPKGQEMLASMENMFGKCVYSLHC